MNKNVEREELRMTDHIKSMEGLKISIDCDELMHLCLGVSTVLQHENEISSKEQTIAMSIIGSALELLHNEPQKAEHIYTQSKKAAMMAAEMKRALEEKKPEEALKMLLEQLSEM